MAAIGPTAAGVMALSLFAVPAVAQEAPAPQPSSVSSDQTQAAPPVAEARPAAEPQPAEKSETPFTLDQLTTYGSLGLGGGTGNAKGAPGDAGIFNAQAGVRVGPYWGMEVEGGTGLPGDSRSGNHLNLASRYAGYIVGYLPFNKHFDLFAKLGLGHSRYKYEDNGVGVSRDFDGVNWGVGAQYFFNDHDGVRTEVLRENYRDGKGDRSNVFFSWVHRW
jgi:hypothetical protein